MDRGNMIGPRERLRQIVKESGISRRKFAVSIGMSPNGMSGIFNATNRISAVLANSIELIHGYNARWILTGAGRKHTVKKTYEEERDGILKELRLLISENSDET